MDELDKAREEGFDILREYVNLNSDAVVRRLLYRKYKLPILDYTETGEPSVDKEVLMNLKLQHDHPIYNVILRQRSYTKALSTIKSYLKFADERGYIHTNINTNHARTSRQSSSNPNLQNVSKEAAEKNPFPVALRKCFRAPAKELMILSDYAGIELRLLVEMTQEEELLKLLLANPDADLHHLTVECFLMNGLFNFSNDKIFVSGVDAARQLKLDDPKRFKVLRGAFKNTGFCIAYGGGPTKVAFTLGKQVDEIAIGDANYRKRFPKINNYTHDTASIVKSKGYVETAFGRILNVPRDKAYIGANYKIQGTAAGIMKRAQVRVADFCKRELNNRMSIILCIHDEIIYRMSRELYSHKSEILTEVSRLMTDIPEIKVPLRVEHKETTIDWNSAKGFTFKEGDVWSNGRLINVNEPTARKIMKIRRNLSSANV
jgi:DNA polymerase I